MKFVVRFFASISAIALVVLGIVSFILPAETIVMFMSIVGIIAGVLITIVVEWWIKDENYYEERLKKKEQKARVRTHI